MGDIVVQVTKSRHLRDEFSAPKPQYPHGEITIPQFTRLLNLDQRTHNLIVLVTTEVRGFGGLYLFVGPHLVGGPPRRGGLATKTLSWGRAATVTQIGGSQESNIPLVNAIQPFASRRLAWLYPVATAGSGRARILSVASDRHRWR